MSLSREVRSCSRAVFTYWSSNYFWRLANIWRSWPLVGCCASSWFTPISGMMIKERILRRLLWHEHLRGKELTAPVPLMATDLPLEVVATVALLGRGHLWHRWGFLRKIERGKILSIGAQISMKTPKYRDKFLWIIYLHSICNGILKIKNRTPQMIVDFYGNLAGEKYHGAKRERFH